MNLILNQGILALKQMLEVQGHHPMQELLLYYPKMIIHYCLHYDSLMLYCFFPKRAAFYIVNEELSSLLEYGKTDNCKVTYSKGFSRHELTGFLPSLCGIVTKISYLKQGSSVLILCSKSPLLLPGLLHLLPK